MSNQYGNNVDDFADIINSLGDGGVLGGAGRNDFETVKQRITVEGPENKLQCRFCPRDVLLTPTWEEIFYVAQNGPNKPLVLPEGWARSENNLTCYHSRTCPNCGNVGLHVHYDPSEARSLITQAVEQGLVTPAQLQQWKTKIDAIRRMR